MTKRILAVICAYKPLTVSPWLLNLELDWMTWPEERLLQLSQALQASRSLLLPYPAGTIPKAFFRNEGSARSVGGCLAAVFDLLAWSHQMNTIIPSRHYSHYSRG